MHSWQNHIKLKCRESLALNYTVCEQSQPSLSSTYKGSQCGIANGFLDATEEGSRGIRVSRSKVVV